MDPDTLKKVIIAVVALVIAAGAIYFFVFYKPGPTRRTPGKKTPAKKSTGKKTGAITPRLKFEFKYC
jgi:hypothetical protein